MPEVGLDGQGLVLTADREGTDVAPVDLVERGYHLARVAAVANVDDHRLQAASEPPANPAARRPEEDERDEKKDGRGRRRKEAPQAGRQTDGCRRPQTGGSGQASDRRALLEDGTRSQEAHTHDHLGRHA